MQMPCCIQKYKRMVPKQSLVRSVNATEVCANAVVLETSLHPVGVLWKYFRGSERRQSHATQTGLWLLKDLNLNFLNLSKFPLSETISSKVSTVKVW